MIIALNQMVFRLHLAGGENALFLLKGFKINLTLMISQRKIKNSPKVRNLVNFPIFL